jgi:hypothetical protein
LHTRRKYYAATVQPIDEFNPCDITYLTEDNGSILSNLSTTESTKTYEVYKKKNSEIRGSTAIAKILYKKIFTPST